MENDAFRIALRQLTSAVIRAQAAHTTHQQARRTADEVAAAAQSAASSRQDDGQAWARDRLGETRMYVEQGASRLPQEIDAAYISPSPASALDARPGLQTMAHNAQVQAAGIQDGDRKLLLWKARRASIVSGVGIAALIILLLLGLGVSWIVARQRHQVTTVTQTAAAATVAPTLTAAAAISTTTALETEQAIALATSAADEVDGQPTPVDPEEELKEENAPTSTPMLPTRTPRPAPTKGPTPTSFPSGAVVCPGAFPTRLTVGGRARVINYQLNVRSGPGTHHDVVRRLDPGRTVDVLDGPVCDDGQLWYYIISEEIVPRDGSQSYRAEGWLIEESDDAYYLEPIQ